VTGRTTSATTPAITLAPAAGHRPAVEALWQLYQHDLSEFRGTLPDAAGRYRSARLASFFEDPDRTGHLILTPGRGRPAGAGDAPAGFALVRGLAQDRRVMGEFFVVRALRRHGVGRRAAAQVLARHPGPWEIPFQEENPGAARFWRGLATDLAGDAWHEERRPVPNLPGSPPDVWLRLTAGPEHLQ
jgi:predicted acetyltransferase